MCALDELGVSMDELHEYCGTEGDELARYSGQCAKRQEDLSEFKGQSERDDDFASFGIDASALSLALSLVGERAPRRAGIDPVSLGTGPRILLGGLGGRRRWGRRRSEGGGGCGNDGCHRSGRGQQQRDSCPPHIARRRRTAIDITTTTTTSIHTSLTVIPRI